MYHKLRFRTSQELDLQIPGKGRLEKVKFRRGDVIEAYVRPYIIESEDGPVEIADLNLGREGTLVGVPMEFFRFE